MEKEKLKNNLNEPFSEYGHYSYADYLNWQLDEMVELIKGKVFRQIAAPRRIHQEVSGRVFTKIYNYLEKKPCKVYAGPFDVRLPVKSKKNEDIDTVVQPDICVVCDPEKLDELGCVGAPDLIVEILSPGNNSKELQDKYKVYEASGVKEYWVIHPSENTLLIYTLMNGEYKASRLFTTGDTLQSEVIKGFTLEVGDIFERQ
ncbi:Uma2 family endonuclease [Pleomorphovibrio marinus]|uniref:Uma2 family endonuclease n=1 Tax=Pleomorphovibrio marinus TaxID=2164132 RepID=UPI000E0B5CAF|nr:Uma2 family endonuclease [Pleomorphovibrio marinus]